MQESSTLYTSVYILLHVLYYVLGVAILSLALDKMYLEAGSILRK